MGEAGGEDSGLGGAGDPSRERSRDDCSQSRFSDAESLEEFLDANIATTSSCSSEDDDDDDENDEVDEGDGDVGSRAARLGGRRLFLGGIVTWRLMKVQKYF